MKIWLQHKEVGDTTWIYELHDFSDIDDDFSTIEDTKWNDTPDTVDQYINWYLNNEMMSAFPYTWCGGKFEWNFVDNPPKEWLHGKVQQALTAYKYSRARYITACNRAGLEPNFREGD